MIFLFFHPGVLSITFLTPLRFPLRRSPVARPLIMIHDHDRFHDLQTNVENRRPAVAPSHNHPCTSSIGTSQTRVDSVGLCPVNIYLFTFVVIMGFGVFGLGSDTYVSWYLVWYECVEVS